MYETVLISKNEANEPDTTACSCIHQSIFPVSNRDGFTNDRIKEQFKANKRLSIPFGSEDEQKDFIKRFSESGGLDYFKPYNLV